MKTLSNALFSHLSGEVTTLATCWKLTRRDGSVLGFTDHDQPLVYHDTTYMADTGFTPTATASRADFSVDNLEVEGMLSAASITEADILAGRYDYAQVEVFLLNYADTTQGPLILRRGWIGEVSLKNGQFVAEIRGLAQALSQQIGQLYSPSCRATLGDSRCKVDVAVFTVTGSITGMSGNSRQMFTDSTREEGAGYFDGGKLTFTSGDNDGISMEVKTFVNGIITLVLPMPYALAEGDAYSLVAGCDKTLGTCKAVFNNVLNFRGEPHVPGLDKMMQTAGTR